jgi:hypothetical protein
MAEWCKGEDEMESGADFMTYGITKDDHTNGIEVFTSERDRNLILALLRRYEEYKKKKVQG